MLKSIMDLLWVFLALLSGFFFALKDVLAKRMFRKDVSPKQLVFEEYLLLLLISMALLYPYIEFSSYSELWNYYLIKAVSVGIFTFLYFELLKKYEISTISPLLNLSPAILIVLSFLFLGEILTYLQLFGIVLIIGSTYVLEVVISHHSSKNPHREHFSIFDKFNWKFISVVLIMLFGLSFAAIYDRLILSEVNVHTNMFFTAFIISFFMIIYYIKESSLIKAFKNTIREPETLVISFFTIISNFLVLFAISIPTALVSLIIPLRRTSSLFSAILGGLIFHEKHIKQKAISISVMLIGILLIVF